MSLIVAVIGTVGMGAVVLVLVILARLTQKWELVTRSRSHYRLFYAASLLVGLASMARMVRIGYVNPAPGAPAFLLDPHSWFYLCFYHIPLAVGSTISLIVTWRNWGWLVKERSE